MEHLTEDQIKRIEGIKSSLLKSNEELIPVGVICLRGNTGAGLLTLNAHYDDVFNLMIAMVDRVNKADGDVLKGANKVELL